MESELLSHIHIAIPAEKANADLVPDSSTFFSYNFNISSEEEINATFHFLFAKKPEMPFSLTLLLNNRITNIDSYWLERLYLILCHPSYIKTDNKHIIGISRAPENNELNFIERLKKELQKQGFSDLLFVEANKNNNPSFCFYNENIPDADFYQWYLTGLIESQSLLNIFCVFNDKELVKKLSLLRKNTENRLQSAQPIIYQLISQLQKHLSGISQYKLITNHLTEELSSKAAYIDFILEEYKEGDGENLNFNEAMKVKRFYYHEYEILPLWYKRFGHLLKVIMGKRTFKSLFNVNVKKYKD